MSAIRQVSCDRQVSVSKRQRRARSIRASASTVSSRSIVPDKVATDVKSADCPFTAVKSLISKPSSPKGEHYDYPPPPGPPAFALESALDVGKILTDGIHGAMLHFQSKYGDICRYANPSDLNGASGWVFINNPENVQHCCATNVRNYQRRYLPDVYKFATHEKGILGSQDDYNTKHRRMCSPPFKAPRLLRQFSSIITERAVVACDILAEAARLRHTSERGAGGAMEVDISVHTQRLTLDIVALTAFSHDFKQVDQIRKELIEPHSSGEAESEQDRMLWAFNTFGEVLSEVFVTPLPVLRVLDLIGFQELKRLKKSTDIMRESMLPVIAARREEMAKGLDVPDDLLSSLLTVIDDDGSGLSNEELWEDVHDIMGAGHETTATTAAAAVYCCSVHPHVETRLLDELRDVCGDEAPTYDDLERLPYLKQVIKEVLRLYPAIPIFPREAQENDILPSGHRVDAGDVVFMSSYALGRSSALWDDVLTFNPDRFAPEHADSIHRFQWLPFGAGPRMCLGSSWAQMSVALMTATLLQRLQFKAVSPTEQLIPVGYDMTMNYLPTGGLHMICEPRGGFAESVSGVEAAAVREAVTA